MKNILPLLAIVTLMITGCSKSNSNPKPGGDNSTTLLTSSIILGEGLPLTDTFSVTKYQYDSQNRLVLAATHVIKSGNIDSNIYHYDNDGNLVKINYQDEGDGKKLIGESDITYLSGIPVSIYDTNSTLTTSLNYQVANNKIVGFSLASATGTLTSENGTITYDGDNIKSVSITATGGDLTFTRNATNTYNTDKGALSIGNKWYLFGAGAAVPVNGQSELASQTTEESDPRTNTIVTSITSNTYVNNSEGYPTKISTIFNGTPLLIIYNTYTTK